MNDRKELRAILDIDIAINVRETIIDEVLKWHTYKLNEARIDEVEKCYADVMSVSVDRHIQHQRSRIKMLQGGKES